MNRYHIRYRKHGNPYPVNAWVDARSALQAVYFYIRRVPGDRWLMGLFKKGDPSIEVTMEKGMEQLALF